MNCILQGQIKGANKELSNLSNYQKALKNIGGRPNKNLLDNWYFVGGGTDGKFPINQRGQTSYNTAGYSIDRWINTGGTVSLTGDGIGLSGGSINQELYQLLESTDVKGKTCTISELLSTGLAQGTFVFPTEIGSSVVAFDDHEKFALIARVVDTGLPACSLWTYGGKTNTVLAAKLELGPTQTLAYQDEEGNWQLFETPDYAEELAKCQRYLFNPLMGGLEWSQIMYGYAYSDTKISCTLTLPVNMRTLPAIVQSGSFRCVGAEIILKAAGFNVVDCSGNTIRIDVSVSGAKASEVYVFMRDNDSASKLLLSAEL